MTGRKCRCNLSSNTPRRAIEGLSPVLRPLGLTGVGVFAALQISFVSFAASVATLSMME